MNLREWVLRQRLDNPLFSQKDFALRLGMSQHHFSAVKNNSIAFSMTTAMKIERLTNHQVDATKMFRENMEKFPRIRGNDKFKKRKKRIKNEDNGH
jgi:plasmid maintenance system antidote protein VapI